MSGTIPGQAAWTCLCLAVSSAKNPDQHTPLSQSGVPISELSSRALGPFLEASPHLSSSGPRTTAIAPDQSLRLDCCGSGDKPCGLRNRHLYGYGLQCG
jgi:hypothetical protein